MVLIEIILKRLALFVHLESPGVHLQKQASFQDVGKSLSEFV
jgi:hypothetical protein